MEQLKLDILRFVDLLSKFTGISKTKLDDFLKSNSVNNIFENPTALEITYKQLEKIEALRELKGLYNNLKIAESEKYALDSSTRAGNYFKNYFLGIKDKERFVCGFLDNQNRIIATKVVFEGTINEAPVYPREIVKMSLLNNASSVVLAHNHPGGSLIPSSADIAVTKKVGAALNTVNIQILDHIIVAGDSYYSFAEKGLSLREDTKQYKIGDKKLIEDGESLISKLKGFQENKFLDRKGKKLNYTADDSNDLKLSGKASSIIDSLNEIFESSLTVKELNNLYKAAGKMYEASGDVRDLKLYQSLNEVIGEIRKTQAAYRKEQNKEKDVKNMLKNKDLDMEV